MSSRQRRIDSLRRQARDHSKAMAQLCPDTFGEVGGLTLARSSGQTWFSAGLARARGLEDEYRLAYAVRIRDGVSEDEAANSALRAIGVPDVEPTDD